MVAAIETASKVPALPPSLAIFTQDGFALIQRIAKAYSESSLVPQQYQGNFANSVIACNMAIRMEADPLMVMQNLYIVHGKPSWSAQYYISALNSCGRYSSLRYEWFGQPNRDDWGCRAWVTEKGTGERIEGPLVTIGMAKAEGWFNKNGSKWKTMPELMLTYRAAAFFVRTHAPELTMGLPMADEITDTVDAAAAPRRGGMRKSTIAEIVEDIDSPPMLPELPPEPEPAYTTPEAELADPDHLDFIQAFADEHPKEWAKLSKRLEISRPDDCSAAQAEAAVNEIKAFREKKSELFGGGSEGNAYKGGH